jgi:hypothetical protein
VICRAWIQCRDEENEEDLILIDCGAFTKVRTSKPEIIHIGELILVDSKRSIVPGNMRRSGYYAASARSNHQKYGG